MAKIGLTGASGHVGYVLYKMLEQQGIPPRILLRSTPSYLPGSGAEVVCGSLEDEGSRAALVKGCSSVVHCAGVVWPKKGPNQEVLRVNYELTRALYADAVKAGVGQFIFVSSIHSMIVPPCGSVFDEGASLVEEASKPYDYSKAASERFLSEASGSSNTRVVIVNPTAIIGPGDHYLRGLNQLFDRLHRGRLPAVTAGGFDVVDVRDVARGILEACRQHAEGKFMLSGKYYTMTDLAALYGAASNRKAPRFVIGPAWMKILAGISAPIDRFSRQPLPINSYSVETLLEGHSGISSDKARRQLGYSARPIEETLSDLYHWFEHQELKL